MLLLSRRTSLAVLAAGLLLAAPATGAAPLPRPTGKIILRITGKIADRNSDEAAEFDTAMLQQLGLVDVVTHTPWTEGEVRFTGVPVRALLQAVGAATPEALEAVALNDYRIEVPGQDLQDFPLLLAMQLDGRPLRVRDKGPLWLIYPWSDHPEIDNTHYHARSIWQLKSIVVR